MHIFKRQYSKLSRLAKVNPSSELCVLVPRCLTKYERRHLIGNEHDKLTVEDIERMRPNKQNEAFLSNIVNFEQTYSKLGVALNASLAKKYLSETYGLKDTGLEQFSESSRLPKRQVTSLAQLIVSLWRYDELYKRFLAPTYMYGTRLVLPVPVSAIPNRMLSYLQMQYRASSIRVKGGAVTVAAPIWNLPQIKQRLLRDALLRSQNYDAAVWVFPVTKDPKYVLQPILDFESVYPDDWGHWRLKTSSIKPDFDACIDEDEWKRLFIKRMTSFTEDVAQSVIYQPGKSVKLAQWQDNIMNIVKLSKHLKETPVSLFAELGHLTYESPMEDVASQHVSTFRWPLNQQGVSIVENLEPVLHNLSKAVPVGTLRLVNRAPSPKFMMEKLLGPTMAASDTIFELQFVSSDGHVLYIYFDTTDSKTLRVKTGSLVSEKFSTLVGCPVALCDGRVAARNVRNLSKTELARFCADINVSFSVDQLVMETDAVTFTSDNLESLNFDLASCLLLSRRSYKLEVADPVTVIVDLAVPLDSTTYAASKLLSRARAKRVFSSSKFIEKPFNRVQVVSGSITSNSISDQLQQFLNSVIYICKSM